MDDPGFTEPEFDGEPARFVDVLPSGDEQEPAKLALEKKFDAADVALDLARRLIDNADKMLLAAVSALETGGTAWPGGLALGIVRRHFHTNASSRDTAEAANIREVRSVFQKIRIASANAASIVRFVDDATASQNTRGFYDSEFDVAAYAYSHGHIALTNKFPALGPNCRAAVIIHQLAHFVDPRIRDIAGVRGPAYDALDFESARFNVHCYPNFAVNAFPPFVDERFGMTRPTL